MISQTLIAAGLALMAPMAAAAEAVAPSDAQIAHIAYTAGAVDIAAARQALAKSHAGPVMAFAQEMARDHGAANDQALALTKTLGVTPQNNPTSAALQAGGETKLRELAKLDGEAFDRAYVANEVAFHRTVNGALETGLIPSARNAELKALLQTCLKLFQEHEHHAEMLSGGLK